MFRYVIATKKMFINFQYLIDIKVDKLQKIKKDGQPGIKFDIKLFVNKKTKLLFEMFEQN